ncbi:MAG TPA: DinB family protein [Acidimicrobiales bacterium]|jgi:hypothetical protein|nr:DinB family protein [Acidimicrobiales bacterium]
MPVTEHATLLERLKATARDLVSLTSGVARAQMERRPGPREWSANMVVAHLADAELVYGFRLKTILIEDRPHISPYDENAWTERFTRVDEDVKDTLGRWRVLREHNVRLLESLEEPEWRRAGVHAQRGEMTVRQVVAMMAEHDRGHLDQLRRAVSN